MIVTFYQHENSWNRVRSKDKLSISRSKTKQQSILAFKLFDGKTNENGTVQIIIATDCGRKCETFKY
jgi:hypothetical protein